MFYGTTSTIQGMNLKSLDEYGDGLKKAWFTEYVNKGVIPKMKIGKSFKHTRT